MIGQPDVVIVGRNFNCSGVNRSTDFEVCSFGSLPFDCVSHE